jgi:hypothetical protein
MSTTKTIRASSRKNRVYVFRDFLCETYFANNANDNYLKAGDIVLDVAGGKGDLSWLLMNVDGLKSVVVDPRSLSSTSHLIRSVVWLEEHPEDAKERSIPHLPTHQPLAGLLPKILQQKTSRKERGVSTNNTEFLEPQHLQIKLDDDLTQALRCSYQQQDGDSKRNRKNAAACPEVWTKYWMRRQLNQNKDASTTSKVNNKSELFLPESERTSSTAPLPPIEDPVQAWNIFQSIKLILGFHPDQATEACLELAKILQIPLCIVPCCVFPSEFPDRTISVVVRGGPYEEPTTITTRVRTYEQFLQYLQEKQPKLRTATLTFHATETSRNIVLYTLPEDLQEKKDLGNHSV